MSDREFGLIFEDSLEEFTKMRDGRIYFNLDKANTIDGEVDIIKKGILEVYPKLKHKIDVFASFSNDGTTLVQIFMDRQQANIPDIPILTKYELFDLLDKVNLRSNSNKINNAKNKSNNDSKPLTNPQLNQQSIFPPIPSQESPVSNHPQNNGLSEAIPVVGLPVRVVSLSLDKKQIFTHTIASSAVHLRSIKFSTSNMKDIDLAIIAYQLGAECTASFSYKKTERNKFTPYDKFNFPDHVVKFYDMLQALKSIKTSRKEEALRALFSEVTNQGLV
jgi:hypothetical protein